MTFLELDQKLEKWVKFHSSLLMAATLHALELPRDVTRSRSYMLHLEVFYHPDHTGINARAFRFINASVIDMASAEALGEIWVNSVKQIRELREESEAKGLGTVVAVALECKPLAVQVVPFGSIRDLSRLKIQPRWKDILKRDIESGRKFTRFEMED